MRLRDQVALTLPSLFLRLVLGITFLWAGTGKFMGTMTVSGDDAARLANAGITLNAIDLSQPADNTTQDIQNQKPPHSLPGSIQDQPAELVNDIEDTPENLSETQIQQKLDGSELPTDPEPNLQSEPQSETLQDTPDPLSDPLSHFDSQQDRLSYTWTRTQNSPTIYAGSDFPEPMQTKRLYGIALLITKASSPGLTADSKPITPIMPEMLGDGHWPRTLAWAAAVTELVAGFLLVVGFFTRFSAMSVFCVMLVAMWMTQIGPAALQSDDAILGFIPYKDQPWSPASYMPVLWQLALAAMSGAVFFLGSGSIGLDRLIFRPRVRDPYIHGDPKASRDQQTSSADRSEFDRTPNHTP